MIEVVALILFGWVSGGIIGVLLAKRTLSKMAEIANRGISVKLSIPYEQAVESTKEMLKDEGFGVLTEIDVKATLHKTLDVSFNKYIILGAWNPSYAYKSLQVAPEIGLLLPCNVIIYEDEDASVVSAISPLAAIGDLDHPVLYTMSKKLTGSLRRVITNLKDSWG